MKKSVKETSTEKSSYSEMHPQDLIMLMREGDQGAFDFLNSLPSDEMHAKVRAGAEPWSPILIKAEQMAALRRGATRDGRCLVCGQPKPGST
jgi:hypothetical protein